MSFEDNVKINMTMAKDFQKWVKTFAGDDSGYLDDLYEAAIGYLLGSEHENNWDSVDYFNLSINSPLYIAHLKEFDTKLALSEYTPDWGMYEPNVNVLDFPPDRVENAVRQVKQTGDLFYFYVMMLVYFGGITIYHHTKQALPYFTQDLIRYLRPLKVYVTARKMEKEYSRADVLKAVGHADLAEPINPDDFAPYLLESNSVVRKDGKYYLTEDIIKAMTAAGGVAQALERQDLEGGMENAASKQGRPRKLNGRTDSDDKEDNDDTDATTKR